jgi:hypothetical protein
VTVVDAVDATKNITKFSCFFTYLPLRFSQ